MSNFTVEKTPFRGKDLVGARFGKVSVIRFAGFKRPYRFKPQLREAYWFCVCDCGKKHISSGHDLKCGDVKSCGCSHLEIPKRLFKKHGLAHKHPLYYRWCGMIARCNNSKHNSYHNYGGRGITVCKRWKDFNNFIADMFPTFVEGLTLEREDTNGNYEPKNCKWATWKEQHQNRRNSNPKYARIAGD